MTTSQIGASSWSCSNTPIKHLLYYDLYPSPTTLKKVASIALGSLLIIGLLFAAYSAITLSLSKPSTAASSRPSSEEVAAAAIDDRFIKKSPPFGQAAIQFAEESVKQLTVTRFEAKDLYENQYPPVNNQITMLTGLYEYVYFMRLKDALQTHPTDSWKQQPVLEAADELMKIAYTIGCLTLEDLKPFTEQLEATRGIEFKRTYAQALASKDSYQSVTFYLCTNIYFWLKRGMRWGQDEKGGRLVLPRGPTPSAHLRPFYQEGTLQNSWRLLYNDYCDRVRSYISDDDLKVRSTIQWPEKDTSEKPNLDF